MDRKTRARGLRKVPKETVRVYRAVGKVLHFTEAKCDQGAPSVLWWNLTLDLRDLRSDIEARYPVLEKKGKKKK